MCTCGAVFSPLATKFFGSDSIERRHRISMMISLILSRLLFNVHITVPTIRDMKAFNAVHMRVLRRIIGDMRFSADVVHTDRRVRDILVQPSIDCILTRARLKYAKRLLVNRPRALVALLSIRENGQPIPWVMLLADDCEVLRRNNDEANNLGPLLVDHSAWYLFMMSDNWNHMVNSIHFHISITDRDLDSQQAKNVGAHQCIDCGDNFASGRALGSHRRAKHGVRNDIRLFVSSAVCPACGINFQQRLRCIAHLSDKRRPKCTAWVRDNVKQISRALSLKLDEKDASLRLAAQRAGRTRHIASLPARTKNGNIVGRVSSYRFLITLCRRGLFLRLLQLHLATTMP